MLADHADHVAEKNAVATGQPANGGRDSAQRPAAEHPPRRARKRPSARTVLAALGLLAVAQALMRWRQDVNVAKRKQ